jgi:hypothetical protein
VAGQSRCASYISNFQRRPSTHDWNIANLACNCFVWARGIVAYGADRIFAIVPFTVAGHYDKLCQPNRTSELSRAPRQESATQSYRERDLQTRGSPATVHPEIHADLTRSIASLIKCMIEDIWEGNAAVTKKRELDERAFDSHANFGHTSGREINQISRSARIKARLHLACV